jgi:hypothetical protein
MKEILPLKPPVVDVDLVAYIRKLQADVAKALAIPPELLEQQRQAGTAAQQSHRKEFNTPVTEKCGDSCRTER